MDTHPDAHPARMEPRLALTCLHPAHTELRPLSEAVALAVDSHLVMDHPAVDSHLVMDLLVMDRPAVDTTL